MKTLTTIEEVRHWAQAQRKAGKAVHFVPTMGYFHEGHLNLMRQAKADGGAVIVSLFVNPTQFAPHEDLAKYPRDVERDSVMAESVGVDALFMPEPQEIYPPDFQTKVEVTRLSQPLCGVSRPRHFGGVAVVVLKLFHIVEPDRAYFGEKDYQQMRLIQRMVRDLNLRVEIVPCPITREPDGMAMSSRNVYLSPEQRQAALSLNRALLWAQSQVESGARDLTQIQAGACAVIEAEPLARLDYVEVVHADTLEPIAELHDRALLALAVYFGQTRLIDNCVLSVD